MTEPPKPRILFVEDDIGKRYVIARQLRQHGFDVQECETGEQGIKSVSPEHDVAILDIKLPDMYGWDVCKRIKENPETATIKVLELSATLASAEDRATGLELVADCYLVHPVELVELVAALRSLIRLRHAERDRLRARELLLATLGHDLRNPLNVIATGLSVLAESPTLVPADRDIVIRVDRTVDRMRRMIDQLMVFAQTLGGEVVQVSPATIDLTDLARQVVAEAEPAAKHPIEIESTLEEPIVGDPDKLTRLVENLVINGVRHGDGPIKLRLSREDSCAVLAVHNDGPAISADLMPTLFDPFTRAKKSGGFGLGLYIVNQFARAHRGSVHVESSDQTGTTFTVKLPFGPS